MHSPAPALGSLRLTRLTLVAADRGVWGGEEEEGEEGGDGKRKERVRERESK